MTDEIWKDIPNYEGAYQISNLGRVRSTGKHRQRAKLMRLYRRKIDGYVHVTLVKIGNTSRKTHKVHRLVATSFLINDMNLPDVDHINGIKNDNRIVNLRWSSKSNNSLNRHKSFGKTNLVGIFPTTTKKLGYRVYLCVNYKNKYIGTFIKKEDAIKARQEALRRLSHG